MIFRKKPPKFLIIFLKNKKKLAIAFVLLKQDKSMQLSFVEKS